MTVIWHKYTGKTGALSESGPSVHFNFIPTRPSAKVPAKAQHLIGRLQKGSLLREYMEYKYGLIDSAPLHASLGINLPLQMSRLHKDKWRRSNGYTVPN